MSVKVYQNVLNFAKTAEKFLFLDGAGCSADIPEDFWQSLAQHPENVQSYLACLIARLISLETRHGLRPLGDIYRELSMTGDDAKELKGWLQTQAPWDPNRKHLAIYLQRMIVCTIYHLKTFYGYAYHPCVKSMYSLWNKVRGADGLNPADNFEIKVMADLGCMGSQHSSLGRWFFQIIEDREELERQIQELVDQCSLNHRDPTSGVQSLGSLSICSYSAVAESLSYYKLLDILKHDPTMVDSAVSCIMARLEEATTSTDVEKSEVTILPLLQLFKSIAPMASAMKVTEAYQSLTPLYLWPQPFACETRKVLDFLQEESRLKGSTFRKTISAEQNISFAKGSPKDQCSYVLVDKCGGVCRAAAFLNAFENVSSRANSRSVKKLLLKHIFKAVGEWEDKRMEELSRQLESCSNLDDCYREAQVVLETAKTKSEDNSAFDQFVKESLEGIYSLIETDQGVSETDSASTTGLGGLGDMDQKSPSPDRTTPNLHISAYPSPPLTVRGVNSASPESVKDLLKECIIKSGVKISKLQRKSINPKKTFVKRKKSHARVSSPATETEETSSISEHSEVGAENGWDETVKGSRMSPSSVSPPLNMQVLDLDQPLSPATISSSSSLEFQIVFNGEDTPSNGPSRNTSLTRPQSGDSRTHSPLYSPTHSMRNTDGPAPSSPMRRRMTGTRPKDRQLPSIKKSSFKNSFHTKANEDIRREVKVVVVGNDRTLSRMANAYAELRHDEPALFSNLEVRFYYIPLSVTTFTEDSSALKKKENCMPEFLAETSQNSILGEDIWLACYLSQFDSWYERNVVLAVHKALRVIPAWDEAAHPLTPAHTSPLMPSFSVNQKLPPSPPQVKTHAMDSHINLPHVVHQISCILHHFCILIKLP
jgi:hypothetical protein